MSGMIKMPDDEIDLTLKLKNKKFSDLKTGQKALFITCILVIIGTLVYSGLHLDSLHYRTDKIKNINTGCMMEFPNGIFHSVECPKDAEMSLFNISGELTTEYTLEQYYSTVKNNPFYNITMNKKGGLDE